MGINIKQSIEDLAVQRGRAVAKNGAIYDSAKEARDAESSAKTAKNAKDFDKLKKECLTSVAAGEKAIKTWQPEMDRWDAEIQSLEKEFAAEKDKIAQQQKEAEAVSKAIDDINAQIKEYNDSLILKERDPRARPYFAKKNTGAILDSVASALWEVATLIGKERQIWTSQKQWVSEPIDELKDIKGRVSKAKFTPPKK